MDVYWSKFANILLNNWVLTTPHNSSKEDILIKWMKEYRFNLSIYVRGWGLCSEKFSCYKLWNHSVATWTYSMLLYKKVPSIKLKLIIANRTMCMFLLYQTYFSTSLGIFLRFFKSGIETRCLLTDFFILKSIFKN